MRTTLQLDDELVVQAKISAARSARTLSQVIEDALRQALASHTEPTRRRASVPTSPGGPLPGVNLDDNAGLLDLMDAERGAHRSGPRTAFWMQTAVTSAE